jgi:hypothetical protein
MRPDTTLRLLLAAATLLAGASAAAAEPGGETCAAIRQRIDQGPPGDADLLRTLAVRGDCRFAAAEVYRAAHGDKPMPREAPRRRHRHEHDDEDDD